LPKCLIHEGPFQRQYPELKCHKMRKIIVSMNVTLDGFMAGPGCELDWHFNYWNEEMSEYATEQLSYADTILLGRVTYNAMANYWPFVATNLSYPGKNIAFADMMNNHKKVVFSGTLEKAAWNNTRLAKENTSRKILKLKQQPGKNIIIYGSGSIVSALMRWDLIDEYVLWVHPVVLGRGKPLFKGLPDGFKLKLAGTKIFNSGVVLIYYKAGRKHKGKEMPAVAFY
jgi:dihydrofolate reductase